MSYPKGKDIKVPFDCLWHYYTRKYEIKEKGRLFGKYPFPEDFEKW